MHKGRCPPRATPQWTLQTSESLRISNGVEPHTLEHCLDGPVIS